MNKRIKKKQAKQSEFRDKREDCGFRVLGELFATRVAEVMATPSRTNLLFATEQELLAEFNRTHAWVWTRW
jgi:hypothetical protein